MVNIYRTGLILLLIGFGSDSAHASTSRLQTYVSTKGSLILQQEKSSSFFFAQQMEDSIKVGGVDSIKLKDPNQAIFYAFIPGILIHGSGHFYAGKTKTGVVLLGAEAAGGLLIYGSVIFTMAGGQTEAGLMALTGAILFIGSWVYDVVGSPIAVVRRNRYLREIRGSKYDLNGQQRDFKLTFVCHFPI